ncbi:hypothetical protein B0T26DRAFT_163560 [Lasiosphaeria miniovina]|uniref:Uncharacterized protein n=1 Tax=Lasiosphaeria miniovina TaxID=1954250 RepID=A0AA40E5W0_9PEZI|nr:uncharacterized protein B0T26DRAFT_163560 [Lasiosphaeria miniovina]KAK0728210.1 hypothetical protein B0T26DRAFT_163560 [Lasiosphaeria miniovina]
MAPGAMLCRVVGCPFPTPGLCIVYITLPFGKRVGPAPFRILLAGVAIGNHHHGRPTVESAINAPSSILHSPSPSRTQSKESPLAIRRPRGAKYRAAKLDHNTTLAVFGMHCVEMINRAKIITLHREMMPWQPQSPSASCNFVMTACRCSARRLVQALGTITLALDSTQRPLQARESCAREAPRGEVGRGEHDDDMMRSIFRSLF